MDVAEIERISEKMGEAVHNAWMEKRRREKGWHSPEAHAILLEHEGKGKLEVISILEDCPNCHPCMRPYKDLPDTEKELDRLYPGLFFKILDEMGYDVVRKV